MRACLLPAASSCSSWLARRVCPGRGFQAWSEMGVSRQAPTTEEKVVRQRGTAVSVGAVFQGHWLPRRRSRSRGRVRACPTSSWRE